MRYFSVLRGFFLGDFCQNYLRFVWAVDCVCISNRMVWSAIGDLWARVNISKTNKKLKERSEFNLCSLKYLRVVINPGLHSKPFDYWLIICIQNICYVLVTRKSWPARQSIDHVSTYFLPKYKIHCNLCAVTKLIKHSPFGAKWYFTTPSSATLFLVMVINFILINSSCEYLFSCPNIRKFKCCKKLLSFLLSKFPDNRTPCDDVDYYGNDFVMPLSVYLCKIMVIPVV